MDTEILDFLCSAIEGQDAECDIKIEKTQELADGSGYLAVFEYFGKKDCGGGLS